MTLAPPASGENGSTPRPSAARGPRRLRAVGYEGQVLPRVPRSAQPITCRSSSRASWVASARSQRSGIG
jgi:hypothetical protein